jgi:hypothetical protein
MVSNAYIGRETLEHILIHLYNKQQSGLTTASGFQCVTGGTGSMGAPSLSKSQLTSSTPERVESQVQL